MKIDYKKIPKKYLIIVVVVFVLLIVVAIFLGIKNKRKNNLGKIVTVEMPKSKISIKTEGQNVTINVDGKTPITGANLVVCYDQSVTLKAKSQEKGDILGATQYSSKEKIKGKKCDKFLVLPVDNMAPDEKYLSKMDILKLEVTGDATKAKIELILDKSEMIGIYKEGTNVGFE